MSFVIFQINTNLLINQLNKIFLHKTPYAPPSFQQKTCALHCRCFQKYPLFTIFLLVFTVNQVCYVSNKYHPPNNLTKHQYFYRRDLIPLFHLEKKNWRCPSRSFFETSTSYPIFTIFNSE